MIIFDNKGIKNFEENLILNLKIPALILMENASEKIFNYIIKYKKKYLKNILIICGNGNNGGDGLALARKLIIKNSKSKIFESLDILIIKSDKYSKENFFQQEILFSFNDDFLKQYKINIQFFDKDNLNSILNNLKNISILIDSLLGFGTKGELDQNLKSIINNFNNFINENKIYTISIDVPSGIAEDFDNLAISSNLVLVLGYYKISLFLPFNRKKYKNFCLLDIGFPDFLNFIQNNFKNIYYSNFYSIPSKNIHKSYIINKKFIKEKLREKLIHIRNDFKNKGNFGKLLIFSSSISTLGAPIIASKCSHILGSGLTYLVLNSDDISIKTTLPEIITINYEKFFNEDILNNFNCFLLGPGFGNDIKIFNKIIDKLLFFNFEKDENYKDKKYLIFDADALNIFSKEPNLKEKMKSLSNLYNIIITPHLKEFSRLINLNVDEIEQNILDLIINFYLKYKITIILKNFQSFAILKNNDENILLLNKGLNSGFAKGGSGDILAGAIASFLTQGLNIFETVSLVFYLFDSVKKYEKKYKTSKFSYDYNFIINCLKEELLNILNS